MPTPSKSQRSNLAYCGFGLQLVREDILGFGLLCRLPGVEEIREACFADPKNWDEMSNLASDAHSLWRGWGAAFDEVMFSYVPQQSLF